MSQSIRTPSGIAMRAVAAASLFASKPKTETAPTRDLKTAEKPHEANSSTIRAGLKPIAR